MTFNQIAEKLKTVYKHFDNIRVGLAGSYANNTNTVDSDIDIVLDGDSMRVEIMEYIKSLFDITVDVLWVELMRSEDEELDNLALAYDLPVNTDSVYKTVMREVRWI